MTDRYSISIAVGSWQVLQVIASPEDLGKVIGLMLPELERRLAADSIQRAELQIWKASA